MLLKPFSGNPDVEGARAELTAFSDEYLADFAVKNCK
jgi:hypothetical protein